MFAGNLRSFEQANSVKFASSIKTVSANIEVKMLFYKRLQKQSGTYRYLRLAF